MKTFVFTAAIVYAALATWSQLAPNPEPWNPAPSAWMIWTLVFGLPLGVTWAAGETLNAISPRRALDRRAQAMLTRAAMGLGAGMLGAVLITLGLIFLDAYAPDWLIAGAGALFGTLLVLVWLPRLKVGRCVHCGYDQSGATVRSGGRCVECGRAVMESPTKVEPLGDTVTT